MVRAFHFGRVGVVVLASLVGAISLWVLSAGDPGVRSVSRSPWRRPAGFPQLISSQPLPAADGEMCPWMPASFPLRGAALFQGERSANPSAAVSQAARRKPARIIRDSQAAYSAVAVDPIRNEVVLTDENLFQILVYDRLDNTPPNARMTEPKRLLGGVNTKIEFQCGLYIDPASGDIYAVNNDTVDTLVIFSRRARGNVAPDRELATPHGTYGIAVDEQRQELFLTVQHDSAVVVYRKMAQGNEPPLRLLQGNRTRLADPHGIALDPKRNLIYITNFGASARLVPDAQQKPGPKSAPPNWPLGHDDTVPGSGRFSPPSITVYARDASGDTPPLRVISGPQTRLNWPTGIALDPERGELYVANDAGDSILIFDSSADGDVAPRRVIQGPHSMIQNPTGVYLDLENDELWVANFGNHAATVYERTASGDAAPLRVIRSAPLGQPALGIGNPGALAYDSKRGEILVPN